MNIKLSLVAVGMALLIFGLGGQIMTAQAIPQPPVPGSSVSVTLYVTTEDGSPIQDKTNIPLTTTVYVWGTYSQSPSNSPGIINATVYHSMTNDPYDWNSPVAIYPSTNVTSPSGLLYLGEFTLSQPGYYQFQLYGESINSVGNQITATYSVTAGPVLSEPATLAALGLCITAVGAVLMRKKPSKH